MTISLHIQYAIQILMTENENLASILVKWSYLNFHKFTYRLLFKIH